MTGSLEERARANQTGSELAKTARDTLRDAIRASEDGFKAALPQHITPERFMRAAFTALSTVKNLAGCTQQSVLAGLMQAAQLGLEVSDVRGQCFLIPRKDNRDGGVYKATFQLGYRGMIDLAARSGIVVDAEELRQNDEFDYALGTKAFLHHKPKIDGPRGPVIAYYSTASLGDGRVVFTLMSMSEVEEHRDRFASSRDFKTKDITGPWVSDFDAMARKTLIRARLNYLPVAVELRQALLADSAIETTGTEDIGGIDYGNDLFAIDEGDASTAIDTTAAEERAEASTQTDDEARSSLDLGKTP